MADFVGGAGLKSASLATTVRVTPQGRTVHDGPFAETRELRAETLQMGYSMNRLLHELGDFPPPLLDAIAASPGQRSASSGTFPYVWSCAAAAWQIPPPGAGRRSPPSNIVSAICQPVLMLTDFPRMELKENTAPAGI